jgi:hypothetical protein
MLKNDRHADFEPFRSGITYQEVGGQDGQTINLASTVRATGNTERRQQGGGNDRTAEMQSQENLLPAKTPFKEALDFPRSVEQMQDLP